MTDKDTTNSGVCISTVMEGVRSQYRDEIATLRSTVSRLEGENEELRANKSFDDAAAQNLADVSWENGELKDRLALLEGENKRLKDSLAAERVCSKLNFDRAMELEGKLLALEEKR